jgi:hypothetical protein
VCSSLFSGDVFILQTLALEWHDYFLAPLSTSAMNDNLYLSLLRQHEREDRTVLKLAASAVLGVSEEEVAVQGVPLSENERDILRQAEVFFQRDVTTDPVRWQVRCHGKMWVCAINDTRLASGEALPVKPGDRVEIGLLRFEVATADEAWEHGTPAEKEATKFFDLGELADTPSRWNAASDEDNLFDIVGMHTPHHDEAQPLPDSPGNSDIEALSEDVPEENILGRLAKEYAQVIMNPEYLHQQDWGESVSEPGHPLLLSREEALPRDQEWKKDQSLEDFVSGKLTIQDILDRLGIDDFQPLEVNEPSDNDILMLFAQGVAQGQKQSERIPERTHRDHHRVSLDSHYQPEASDGGSSNPQIGP